MIIISLLIEHRVKMCTFYKAAYLLLLLGISFVSSTKAVKKKQLVCVIGAGLSGLASVKQVAEHTDEFDVVVFEKNSNTGGLWIYSDSIEVDEHNLPVHSSMYKNLRTNLPKEIMVCPDYQNFKGEERSAVTHETVLGYWRNYTDHFNLRQYIQFNTLVEKVIPIAGDDDWRTTSWQIDTRNLDTNETCKTTCDAIMVCNGHYFNPHIPQIPGIETFPGKVIHSHHYRKPEVFAGQTVVVLGASESGIDISNEISEHAKTVYLSHNHAKITSQVPSNIVQVSGVLSANGNTLKLRDGKNITVDAFIFCTGYLFSYPFLNETSSGIRVEKNQVVPLYKHHVNVEHPSMSLIGVPRILNCPMFYSQARYFVSLLRGKAQLPSRADMLADSESHRDVNYALKEHWAYLDDLAVAGGFDKMPDFYRRGLKTWYEYAERNPFEFKKANLRVHENGDVELVVPSSQSENA